MDQLRPQLRYFAAACMMVAVVACSDGQPRANQAASAPAASKVDSILPPSVALERFLSGEPRPAGLSGGLPSAASLVKSGIDALITSDTARVNQMLVTRTEYGALYYPTSIYASKPYELAPDIAWMLNAEASAKGQRRMERRLGGHDLRLIDWTCTKETAEGRNRVLSTCAVTFEMDGAMIVERQLFAAIIERDGEHKFLSYAGDF